MPYNLKDQEANEAIRNALDKLGIEDRETRSYVRQIMVTAGKLHRDDADHLDMKLITNSVKEMRYAFQVFSDFEDRDKISVFGSARAGTEQTSYQDAETFSELAVDEGYMLISGGGPGIMEAVNRGAGAENSFGLHINLPFEALPNRYIRGDKKCIHFRYFFSRKLVFAKETDAVVIFPGGMGTHDELFELLTLLQTGRQHLIPLVLLDRQGFWDDLESYLKETLIPAGTISQTDFQIYDKVEKPEKAIEIINNFYSNFHSSRFVEDEFVVRFENPPSEEDKVNLDDRFGHLCPESGFRVQKGPLEGEEKGAPKGLYRLIFSFSSHDYGELRGLIDHINSWS